MYIRGNETRVNKERKRVELASSYLLSLTVGSVGAGGGGGGKVSVRSAGRGVVGLRGVVLITRRWSGAAQVMILYTFVGATEGS